MRRGVGVGAISKKKAAEAKYKEKGNELAAEQLDQLSRLLNQFRTELEKFTVKHRSDIRRNPEFRKQFQQMCATVGVDPLASSKSFLSERLGIGDFYYELAVQIIEVCLATQPLNGGIITLSDLCDRLMRSRSHASKDDISSYDILKAIDKVRVLGSGFQVIALANGEHLIQSLPGEINNDFAKILEVAQTSAFVTSTQLQEELFWDSIRCSRSLEELVANGLVWVDDDKRGTTERRYWFPGLFCATV